MNYILMPSLEHIALVKIAISLWNKDDIRTRITDYSSVLPRIKDRGLLLHKPNEEPEEWLKIEWKVLKKVAQLNLPKCLREKLFAVIKQIGLELLKWMKHHDLYFIDDSCDLPGHLYWTSLGTIDIKKTVEVLIKDESIPISRRYISACKSCLEDDARELWNSMPESIKAYLYSEEHVLNNEVNQLVVIWTYYLQGDLAKLTDKIREASPYQLEYLSNFMSAEMSPYQLGFLVAAESGNKLATEYFLKKLNPAEREECLMKYDCNINHSDVLSVLLSQMNEKEQIAFFSRNEMNTCNVLRCLLKWPLQSFFKETVTTIMKLELLPEMEFYVVLETIMKPISKDITYRDFNYHELLEHMWLLSDEIYKLYVLYMWAEVRSEQLFHDMAHEGNVMLFLKDADTRMRENIIFTHIRDIISLMYEGKWDTIKSLIQECLSSTDLLKKFKNEFIAECEKAFIEDCEEEDEESFVKFGQNSLNHFNQVIDELISKKNIEEMKNRAEHSQILDDLYQLMRKVNNKKRSIESGECSQAKKLDSMSVAGNNM